MAGAIRFLLIVVWAGVDVELGNADEDAVFSLGVDLSEFILNIVILEGYLKKCRRRRSILFRNLH